MVVVTCAEVFDGVLAGEPERVGEFPDLKSAEDRLRAMIHQFIHKNFEGCGDCGNERGWNAWYSEHEIDRNGYVFFLNGHSAWTDDE